MTAYSEELAELHAKLTEAEIAARIGTITKDSAYLLDALNYIDEAEQKVNGLHSFFDKTRDSIKKRIEENND